MTGPIREGNCITLPYYISQMVHRMAHVVPHIWMRVAGSTWRGVRWLFGDTFVLTFLSLCLLQEAALAWGAIKSLMKRAEAFSHRLCWKDKRPLKQINVEIENFGCKEKGSDGGTSGYDFDGYRHGGVSGGVAAARPLRDFDWPVCFYHFCFVLFRFVVYWWTAVNDKRLRGCYLKWASAIPLVRGYETQKRQASKSERRRRRRRTSVKTWRTFPLQLPATDHEKLLFGWVWNAVPCSSVI